MAALTFLALLAQSGGGRVETLVLPHALRSGESVWLEVKLGVITHGAEIEVTTTSGRMLGTISPFGVRPGNRAGTYTLPVPVEAVANGHVSVRLSLKYYHSERAPTPEEVKSVRIRVAGGDDKHQ